MARARACSAASAPGARSSSGLANAKNIAIGDADEERRVDQAGEQEHAALQHRDQFRLARGGLEELRTHDADADAGAERAEADHEADGDGGVGLDEWR